MTDSAIPNKLLYITFGQIHVHFVNGKIFNKDCVAAIECKSHEEGRDKAFEYFGPKFCFSYFDDEFKKEEMLKWFPIGIIHV